MLVLNFEVWQCLEHIWPVGVSVDKKLKTKNRLFRGNEHSGVSPQFLQRENKIKIPKKENKY